MTERIVNAHRKGGVSKTCSSINVATELASRGYKTCLIDIDSQGNATTGVGFDPDLVVADGHYTVADLIMTDIDLEDAAIHIDGRFGENFWLVPGHKNLESTSNVIADSYCQKFQRDKLSISVTQYEQQYVKRFRDTIAASQSFDFIIMDTPPQLDFITSLGLASADWLIVPMLCCQDSVRALGDLVQYADEIISTFNPNLQLLGLLLAMPDKRTTVFREINQYLIENFGYEGGLFDTTISRAVKVVEAKGKGKSIAEFAPRSKPSLEYGQLTDEIIDRIRKIRAIQQQEETKKVVGGS